MSGASNTRREPEHDGFVFTTEPASYDHLICMKEHHRFLDDALADARVVRTSPGYLWIKVPKRGLTASQWMEKARIASGL